uniref:Uncharacterized protein n=1 Tax=Rhizophora mucronata TaxID=61149 RepID=A0A2P2Q9R3_RHIMU
MKSCAFILIKMQMKEIRFSRIAAQKIIIIIKKEDFRMKLFEFGMDQMVIMII